MKTLVAAIAIASLPGIARAAEFELAGLRSGMTEEQVRSVAPSGFELRTSANGVAVIVKGYDIYATLAFCKGKVMSVSRPIDADVDFVPAVNIALRDRGQPQVMTSSQAWSGPGGGSVESLTLRWVRAGVRYDISITPEGRDGRGDLRHNRGASISFVDLTNLCS